MASDGLEIDEDPAFQRQSWIWQRRSWAAIGAVLAFAAVGGFGDGPLSSAEARDAEGRLQISYERFGRKEAPSEIVIVAAPPPDGRLRLRLGSRFFQNFDVDGLEAYRHSTQVDAEGATFAIDATEGSGTVAVTLEVRPKAPGRARIEIGLEGGPTLSMTQFVYP